jgi:hypothetical protein
MAGLQEEKFWAVVHTAWLLIRKKFLNDIHCAVVRRLYQVVISKYHVVFRYVLKCNFFLLPSENHPWPVFTTNTNIERHYLQAEFHPKSENKYRNFRYNLIYVFE